MHSVPNAFAVTVQCPEYHMDCNLGCDCATYAAKTAGQRQKEVAGCVLDNPNHMMRSNRTKKVAAPPKCCQATN